MEKNTVSSANQLKKSDLVRVINPEGKGKRIMFAGNSITLHGIKEDIGWYNEWGMAASKRENDYVHRLISKVNEIDEDAAYCICQVAEWERNYKNGSETYEYYKDVQEFGADIIIGRFIENCRKEDFDEDVFGREYVSFINWLNMSGNADIIITTGFWKHPGDEKLIEIAHKFNYPVVVLGDLGADDAMMARGLFEHGGVSIHPGDKGMEAISERIWQELRKFF